MHTAKVVLIMLKNIILDRLIILSMSPQPLHSLTIILLWYSSQDGKDNDAHSSM